MLTFTPIQMDHKLPFIYVLLLISSITVSQSNHYVKVGATGSGTSWSDATGNFQSAIDASAVGDNVFVAQGTYQPLINAWFSMKQGVKIYGGFPNTGNPGVSDRNPSIFTTTLSGNGNNVIRNNFTPANPMTSASILDGFTIAGGAAGWGGGISNSNASPIFQNLIVTGNVSTSARGGGFYNSFSNPLFINVLIHTNSSIGTGSNGGGGVANLESNPIFINCTIANNNCSTEGGAVHNVNSDPVFHNCIIFGNSAALYAAIRNQSSSAPSFKYSLIQGSGGSSTYPSNT
ncbi:MAG TPA: hypothetical protein VGB43_07915, partial [Flavobacterium sp.]